MIDRDKGELYEDSYGMVVPEAVREEIDMWKRAPELSSSLPMVRLRSSGEDALGEDDEDELGGVGARFREAAGARPADVPAERDFVGELAAGGGISKLNWLVDVIKRVRTNAARVRPGDYLWELISPQEPSPSGRYAVRLYVCGAWRTVVVDDNMPVDLFGCPVLVWTPKNEQLWPMLLSKAVLKVMAMYRALDRCAAEDVSAFCWLTGWVEEVVELGAGASERLAASASGLPRAPAVGQPADDQPLFDRLMRALRSGGASSAVVLAPSKRDRQVPPRILALTGPPGVGKSEMAAMLLERYADKFGRSVSTTTREPREGEVEGEHYRFVSRAAFGALVDDPKRCFLEHSETYGERYGPSLSSVRDVALAGRCAILSVDVQGVRNLKTDPVFAPHVRSVCIMPPSMEALEERLRKRSTLMESVIQGRIQRVRALSASVDELESDESAAAPFFDERITSLHAGTHTDVFESGYAELRELCAKLSPIVYQMVYGYPVHVLDYADVIPSSTVDKTKAKPLALCGVPGLGKHALIDKLIEEFPNVFALPPVHTSRALDAEHDDCLHPDRLVSVSRAELARGVEDGKYLAHWESKLSVHQEEADLYGILIEDLNRMSTQEKRICLLTLTLNEVKAAKGIEDFDAAYCFVEPPSPEAFEESTRARNKESDERVKERLVGAAAYMEGGENYQYFDEFITNDTIDDCFLQLEEVISRSRPDIVPPGRFIEKRGPGLGGALVVCGPSGVGKSALIDMLKRDFEDRFGFPVSHTTRDPRDGEEEGVDYNYVSRDDFETDVAMGRFLEHSEVGGDLYGTSVAAAEAVSNNGKMCVLGLSVASAKSMRERLLGGQKALFVYVKPPTIDALRERMLKASSEEELTDEQEARLAQAEEQIADATENADMFDVTVVNSDLEDAFVQLRNALAAATDGYLEALPRPLCLNGPMGSGVAKLVDALLAKYPQYFDVPLSTTSRAPLEGEADGVDFHFATKASMKAANAAGQYLEFAADDEDDEGAARSAAVEAAAAAEAEADAAAKTEADAAGSDGADGANAPETSKRKKRKPALYATSYAAIRRVQASGKICLLEADASSIARLRSEGVETTAVYVEPESEAALRAELLGRSLDEEHGEGYVDRVVAKSIEEMGAVRASQAAAAAAIHASSDGAAGDAGSDGDGGADSGQAQSDAGAGEDVDAGSTAMGTVVYDDVVVNHDLEASECRLLEAAQRCAPGLIEACDIWGKGRSLWDPATRVYGNRTTRLIIIGPAASGKTTLADKVAEKCGCPRIGTGELLHHAITSGSELGARAKEALDGGGVVPEEMLVELLVARVQATDCVQRGWVLDGFPRTPAEAEMVLAAGVQCDKLVVLEVEDEVAQARSASRKTDPETGVTYNMDESPPESEEVLARLVTRNDDTEENMVERLDLFHQAVDGVLAHFADVSLSVNGARGVDAILEDILAYVDLEATLGADDPEAIEIASADVLSDESNQWYVAGLLKLRRIPLALLVPASRGKKSDKTPRWAAVDTLEKEFRCCLFSVDPSSFACSATVEHMTSKALPPNKLVRATVESRYTRMLVSLDVAPAEGPETLVPCHYDVERFDWATHPPRESVLRLRTDEQSGVETRLRKGEHLLSMSVDPGFLYWARYLSDAPFTVQDAPEALKEHRSVCTLDVGGSYEALAEPDPEPVFTLWFRHRFSVPESAERALISAQLLAADEDVLPFVNFAFVDNDLGDKTGGVRSLSLLRSLLEEVKPNEHGYTLMAYSLNRRALEGGDYRLQLASDVELEPVESAPSSDPHTFSEEYTANKTMSLFRFLVTAKERTQLALHLKTDATATFKLHVEDPEVEGAEAAPEGGDSGDTEAEANSQAEAAEAAPEGGDSGGTEAEASVGEGADGAAAEQGEEGDAVSADEAADAGSRVSARTWSGDTTLTLPAVTLEAAERPYLLRAELDVIRCPFDADTHQALPMPLKWDLKVYPSVHVDIARDTTEEEVFAAEKASWAETDTQRPVTAKASRDAYLERVRPRGEDEEPPAAPAREYTRGGGEPVAVTLEPDARVVVQRAAEPPAVGPLGVVLAAGEELADRVVLAAETYEERRADMETTLAAAKEIIAERVSQREGGHALREASAARVSAALSEWQESRMVARAALAERRAAYVRRKADEAEKARADAAAAAAAEAAHGGSGDENEQPTAAVE